MYYKIINKDSEVYKKLHELRSSELIIEENNKKLINDKVKLKYSATFGYEGQQNFKRVTSYSGFVFDEPDLVDAKIWKQLKEDKTVYIPNLRTKLGKEMNEFLSNGLQTSWYKRPFQILNIEPGNKFIFPYVEIVGEVIILFLSDKHEPRDENVIEITKKEFESLRNL